jgi:acyl-CoA reductase-like NAD-dependent aldehyde dehydrogenase
MTLPAFIDSNGRPCVPCLIDGKPVVQQAEAGFPVVSAVTGETLHYGQSATAAIAARAVESAAEAFKTYKKTSAEDRRKFLLRAAELFDEKAAEGASRQVAETSCSEHWATWNIGFCVQFCQEFAGVIKQALTGELPPSRAGVPQLAMKEPIGPVLIIVP